MDGAAFGSSPPPWEIPLSPPQMFTDRVETLRVPHSSIVKVQTDRPQGRDCPWGRISSLMAPGPGTSRLLEPSV